MRILSIESSTRSASVAVADCISPLSDDPRQILSVLLTDAGNSNHPIKFLANENTNTIDAIVPVGASAALAPVIDKVLRDSATKAADLDLIAVSIGPGSFTGLRVGIVTAKTLAYATGCQLVGIHAGDVLAFQTLVSCDERPIPKKLAIGLDIGRGEVLSYEYKLKESGFKSNHDGVILKPQDWQHGLYPGSWATGSGLGLIDDSVKCNLVMPESLQPEARSVAALGVAQFFQNGPTDFWKLEPIYSRPSAAEEARARK